MRALLCRGSGFMASRQSYLGGLASRGPIMTRHAPTRQHHQPRLEPCRSGGGGTAHSRNLPNLWCCSAQRRQKACGSEQPADNPQNQADYEAYINNICMRPYPTRTTYSTSQRSPEESQTFGPAEKLSLSLKAPPHKGSPWQLRPASGT